MARSKRKRPKKKKRTPPRAREPAAKPPRIRRKGLYVLALLVAVAALYAFDRGGRVEMVPAQVVDVRIYPHTPAGGERHTHTDAVVEYEGRRKTLERADSLSRGDWIEVRVRRGRLTGLPHYDGYQVVAGVEQLLPGNETPRPWEYDLVLNRHWDPEHGHWHDGPPPAQR